MEGTKYQVIDKIFSVQTLRGRATKCWTVELNSRQYVVKDSWIHSKRGSDEIRTLQSINKNGIQGVPTVVAGGEVKLFDGTIDSTALCRVGIDYYEERYHRRMVLDPMADSLGTFKSKKELIGAFLDITKSMCFDGCSIVFNNLNINY